MSSDEASSKVTYTSISSDYKEPSDIGSPGVVVYGYDGLSMHPVDPPSPNYVPGLEEPEQTSLLPDYVSGPEYPEYLAPFDEEALVEDQPYVVADSLITLSSGYIDESDLEEDLEDESKDGPMDNQLTEEMENPFETGRSAATPPSPPAGHTTARMFVRPQATMPSLSEAEERLARCLAAHVHPSTPLPPLPSSLYLPPPVPTSLPLPSPPLPPLPSSLFIPLPVDRKEDIPEVEYHLIRDAKTRRQRAKEVGYSIRDVWVDPTKAVEEVALTTLEGVNVRVTKLPEVHEEDTEDIYAMIKDAQDIQTRLSQTVDLLIEDREFY
nr:hypothetical protein [Tanacetum cinerariifolium]